MFERLKILYRINGSLIQESQTLLYSWLFLSPYLSHRSPDHPFNQPPWNLAYPLLKHLSLSLDAQHHKHKRSSSSPLITFPCNPTNIPPRQIHIPALKPSSGADTARKQTQQETSPAQVSQKILCCRRCTSLKQVLYP